MSPTCITFQLPDFGTYTLICRSLSFTVGGLGGVGGLGRVDGLGWSWW